jgi:hypothetical protein
MEIAMGLPARALSDEELIHYAGIDEDARMEMARRSIEHRGTYISELTALKQDIESQLEEAAEAESSADDMQECIQRVFDLLKGHDKMEPGEAFEAIEAALVEMSDFAR